MQQVSRHRVRDKIRAMILNGELPAGSKLLQCELAARFKAGQCVIREALLELKACGLVETIDNRGMFVGDISHDALFQSYDVREIHEGLAARLCCRKINRAQVRELIGIAEKAYLLFRDNKPDEAARLDSELHDRLLKISGNKVLVRLKDYYWGLGKILNLRMNAKKIRDEHIAILKAIEDGNEEKAETLIRKHIANGKKTLELLTQKGVFKPAWVVPQQS